VQENALGSLIGSLVDNRYQVKSRLARGGMSTVYLATDQKLDRDVALKVLHPHLANDGNFLERLAREAKAAAKFSHPHVVGVLDQGHDGDTAYLVMEYIKGHTLRDVIKSKGALSPRLALALIDPVVEGLGVAHAAGMVHRDVKPENVLIADDGRIKISDFGLARAVTTTTSTGALIGTVAYLSPELILGNPADARSDIYSTGIMLFEMLTGRQPFDGEVPIQVAYQHVNSTVGPPSGLVPGLAGEVDELVQWCTANDPERRPVDGNALLAELRHIRTNLTDSELDLQPPAAVQAATAAGSAPAVATASGPHGSALPAPTRLPSHMPQSQPGTDLLYKERIKEETLSHFTLADAHEEALVMKGVISRLSKDPRIDGWSVRSDEVEYIALERHDTYVLATWPSTFDASAMLTYLRQMSDKITALFVDGAGYYECEGDQVDWDTADGVGGIRFVRAEIGERTLIWELPDEEHNYDNRFIVVDAVLDLKHLFPLVKGTTDRNVLGLLSEVLGDEELRLVPRDS
jgi:serine/threonine protein kinase